jgi:sugar/nucleoside kinase (ribokinase family)
VVKRGAKGATVMARQDGERLRFEVATEHVQARDTTGAGDAFDAGFLAGWFAARGGGRSLPASLQRAALAGHRAAARQLRADRVELALA